jgi:hypothetical protein
MRRKSLGGRYLAFLAIVYFGAEVGGVSLAASTPPICEEVCSESTACEESCYENMMEFENGNDITCLDYGVYDTEATCCGDSVCEATRGEMGYCNFDCGPIVEGCGECDPYAQTGCGNDEVCTNDECCLAQNNPPPPPAPQCFIVACSQYVPCCANFYCLIDPGWSLGTGTCYPEH